MTEAQKENSKFQRVQEESRIQDKIPSVNNQKTTITLKKIDLKMLYQTFKTKVLEVRRT